MHRKVTGRPAESSEYNPRCADTRDTRSRAASNSRCSGTGTHCLGKGHQLQIFVELGCILKMIATSAKSLNLWSVSRQITLTASEDVSAFDFVCSHYLKRPPQMGGWGVSNHRGAWVTLLFLASAQIALNRKKSSSKRAARAEPALPARPVSLCPPPTQAPRECGGSRLGPPRGGAVLP